MGLTLKGMEVWGDERVLKFSVESDFKLLGYATCQLALKKTVGEMTALEGRCTDLGPQLGPLCLGAGAFITPHLAFMDASALSCYDSPGLVPGPFFYSFREHSLLGLPDNT